MEPLTLAMAAAGTVGGAVVTVLGRLYLDKRRARRAEQQRLQDKWADDTGKVLVAKMEDDQRTRQQLWTWMQEVRERADKAERLIAELRNDYWTLQREHDRCQLRLSKLERYIQRLVDEHGLPPPSTWPPAEGEG